MGEKPRQPSATVRHHASRARQGLFPFEDMNSEGFFFFGTFAHFLGFIVVVKVLFSETYLQRMCQLFLFECVCV